MGKAVVVVIIAALIAAFCFAVMQTRSKLEEASKSTGPTVLLVGTNTPFPPFEERKGEMVVGFDIDLAAAVALALERELVVKDFSDFDALLPALQVGNLDVVVSAMTIREDRDEIVDFSKPYYTASQAILAHKDSGFVHSAAPQPKDFEGMKVAYQEGTTSQYWIEDNLLGKVGLKSTTPFGDINLGLQLLKMGSVDLIIIDQPVAEVFAKAHSDLVIAGTIETGEEYGFAVQEDDPDNLLPTINKVINEMKESGEYDKLLEKWFGGGGDEK